MRYYKIQVLYSGNHKIRNSGWGKYRKQGLLEQCFKSDTGYSIYIHQPILPRDSYSVTVFSFYKNHFKSFQKATFVNQILKLWFLQ